MDGGQRAVELVGPHGYVHGWIKVGADGKAPSAPKAASPKTGGAGSTLDAFKTWRDGLTPAEDKAMRFYQSPGFALMNGQLRGLDAGALKSSEHASDADLTRARQASKNLTKAIAKAPPLPHDTTVYRGFDAGQFGDLTPGKIITDKGFTSVSVNNDAGAVGRAASKAQAEIVLPAGTRAAAGSVRELVLPPGSSFKVVSAVKRGGVTHVKLELVPKGGAKLANDTGGMVELSAQTARLAITPAPAGKPGGPGLYHVKGMALPPYFENIRNALIRSGHTPADAYRITWGAIRRWAHGGGKVHPEVVAAAQAALADLAAKSAIAHAHANEDGAAMTLTWNGTEGIDLAYIAPHLPAGSPQGGQFGSAQVASAAASNKAGKADAHDLHVLHEAHLAHMAKTGTAKTTTAKKASVKKATAAKKPKAVAKPTVNKKKGTVTTTIGGKKVTMTLHQWHQLHVAHQKKGAAATKLAGGDGRFLELAFTEALAERVPPGRREGGRFAPVAVQLSRHDTPEQAAKVINAMEPVQRAVVRASTLPPPGFEWQAGDRLTIAQPG